MLKGGQRSVGQCRVCRDDSGIYSSYRRSGKEDKLVCWVDFAEVDAKGINPTNQPTS